MKCRYKKNIQEETRYEKSQHFIMHNATIPSDSMWERRGSRIGAKSAAGGPFRVCLTNGTVEGSFVN